VRRGRRIHQCFLRFDSNAPAELARTDVLPSSSVVYLALLVLPGFHWRPQLMHRRGRLMFLPHPLQVLFRRRDISGRSRSSPGGACRPSCSLHFRCLFRFGLCCSRALSGPETSTPPGRTFSPSGSSAEERLALAVFRPVPSPTTFQSVERHPPAGPGRRSRPALARPAPLLRHPAAGARPLPLRRLRSGRKGKRRG
jgi:hypothetical protein